MRALVIGAGIAGLSAAVDLAKAGAEVTIADPEDRVGGKLRSSRFAGIDDVDEGADAYLTRVAPAVDLARTVGIESVRHPATGRAAIWHDGLHDLPPGLVLGVPSALTPLVTTRLLSWRGKLRAGADLFLPRSTVDHDNLGRFVRSRLGDEVQERLIDSLIGSIYATDTDNSSLAAVPQLAGLAGSNRSLIRAAQRREKPVSNEPIFAAPAGGMEALASAALAWLQDRGAEWLPRHKVIQLDPSGPSQWVAQTADATLEGTFDGIVIATPSAAAAAILDASGFDGLATDLASIGAADVTMVRLRIPRDQWPERLSGYSGYLVPKPDQRLVTAASFASQKWADWRPDNGDQIVRASLGRDGLAVDHLGDRAALETTVSELERHLGFELSPTEHSVTRWTQGFPQYRPRHHELVERIESGLPSGIELAGASYRGIGVPACIASGSRAAERLAARPPFGTTFV